ncbi:MAG: hypothetical protein ACI87E_002658 [Mariniblastus sp.]|jgi:hypothetical protein
MKIGSSTILLALLFGLAIAVTPNSAIAQFHESFESASTTWKRHEPDCAISEKHWQQRRSNDIETRNRFEKIHVENGPGSRILISHEVDPALVIRELIPSVRIKASRPGVQTLVRIVLPHTPAPSGNGPMTTMLKGPTYRATGKWETLSFADNEKDLEEQLRHEIWILRRKFGPQVDGREAYLDKVVLNLYTGPGEINVQIDDLKLNGIVAADAVAQRTESGRNVIKDNNTRSASFTQDEGKHQSLVVREGTVLLVKKKPFFPRIIQHNGEPFDYLVALGFNTIELPSTATYEQLRQANELDAWIICPAPASAGLRPIDFQYDRVLAWKIGDRLTSRDVPLVQQRVREVRESDQREGRPVIANIASDWSQLSQLADVVSIGVEPIGASFLASQYSDWINARRQSIGGNKPVWADIQTELAKSLVAQIGTLAHKSPPVPIEPQQIKFLIYEAVSGGSRGLRFLSRSRLDGNDPVTVLRAQTLEWANAELGQIEPWAVGGALMGEVPTEDPQLEVTAFKTNRSRLLLIQRPTHHEQYLAGDLPLANIRFQDPASNSTDLAYLIGDVGLTPLPNNRSLAGTNIQIENCPFTAAVVLTQDPLVLNKLNQGYQRIGQQSILKLHTELTEQWLAIMQLIDRQMGRMGRSSASSSAALNDAVNFFRNAQALINSNSPSSAVEFLYRTDERLSLMRREIITGPLGMFQSKTSSPFTTHSSLIPLHWELAGRLATGDWNPNGLAGGDFENLQHMMANGWENWRLDNEAISTQVELSDAAIVDGEYGLRMVVRGKSSNSPLIESIPLWIATPEVPVKGGQLVRIHGWVNVPQSIVGSHDGLTITDSLGGPAMQERIHVTRGWQEFSLYRGVPNNGSLRITFALTGVGEAMLDEVTIRTIDLPNSTARQAKNQ